MPTIARLSVTPVKGLALHHPERVDLGRDGIPGNRAFFLVDAGGRLTSSGAHSELARAAAAYDPEARRLEVRFPDGTVVAGEVELAGTTVVDFYGRPVAGSFVVGPWSEALTAYVGERVELLHAPNGGWDVEPLTLVSAESCAELARQAGVECVDARRFRMNVEIEGGAGPHEEDAWAGRTVRAGGAVLEILGPVARCVVTTRDPDTGKRDLDTLRIVKSYRGLREGKNVDFGVYASVVEPGPVAIGDTVELLER